MNLEDFLKKTQGITSNLSDQGFVTKELTEIYDEYKKVYEEKEQFSSVNKTLTEDNKKLKEYNIELFMQVGKQDEKIDNDNKKLQGNDKDPEDNKLSYDDLFNEKGEFK